MSVMQRVILKEIFLKGNMNYVWFLVIWFNTEDKKNNQKILIYVYFPRDSYEI